MPKMNDEELLALARQELETADTQGTNALREQRIESLDVYVGELRGRLRNSTGLSSVLMNEHFDYTNRLTTYILNAISGDKEVVKFVTNNLQKAAAAKQLEELVNFSIMRYNNGFYNFEEWIRDACISKVGVVKYWWDTTPHSWEEEIDIGDGDIDQFINAQMNQLGDDIEIDIVGKPEITALEVSESATDASGALSEEITTEVVSQIYTLRYTSYGRPMWESIPREEFVVNIETVGLNDELTRFVGHKREMMIGDVVSMYPEWFKKEARKDGVSLEEAATLVATQGDSTNNFDYDYERINRFAWDGSYGVIGQDENNVDPMTRRVQLVEGYYKVDYNKDGRLQWLRMVWAGSKIFEKELVEYHPFCSFAPFPIPHKFDGQSVYDVIESVMRAQTGLMRSKIDNNVQRNIVRYFYDSNQNRGLNSNMQSGKAGGIAIKNLSSTSVIPFEVPLGANDTVAILSYLDQKISAKIGISSVNDGTNVDLLKSGNDAAKIQAVQTQATQNVEMYVRRLAETGVKELVFGFVRMLLQNSESFFVRDLVQRMYGPTVPFIAAAEAMDFRREDLMAKVGIGHQNKQEQQQAHQNVFQMMSAAEQAGIQIGPEKKLKWLEDGIRMEGIENAYDYIPTPEELAQQLQAQQQSPLAQVAQEAALAEAQMPIAELQKTQAEAAQKQADAQKKQMEAGSESVDQHKALAELRHERPFRTNS